MRLRGTLRLQRLRIHGQQQLWMQRMWQLQ